MKGTYYSVANAVAKFPALKRTVELAKEFDIKIVGHFAQLTKRGKVCCHWWLVLDNDTNVKEYQRNRDLTGWLKNCKQYQKNFGNEKKI